MNPTLLVIAWFALPVLVAAVVMLACKRLHPVLVGILCLVTIVAGTIILANYVWALDAQLLAEMDKYEQGTPEADRAAEEWANDTDRSFLLLLSPVLTGLWYAGIFLLLFGVQWLMRKLFPSKSPTPPMGLPIEPIEPQGDDGNPYQSPTDG